MPPRTIQNRHHNQDQLMPYLRHIYLLLAATLIAPVIVTPANAMTVPSIDIVAGEPESTPSDEDKSDLEQGHNDAAEKDVETKAEKDNNPDSQTGSPASPDKDTRDQ